MFGRLVVCVVVAVAGCGSAGPPAVEPAKKAGLHVDELRAAVFEVVVPKHEPAGVEYAEPLPFHLLPKHVRDDAYLSIGTAFTMDGTTFISAAHVFLLHVETQVGERRLRGADGAIHEIDRFVRHSGTRDLVVFTLRDGPAVAAPLARGGSPEIGATIYTVGNALGEGLSVRGGNVASFTPEPLDGAWKFIRYSAPASPGNSGGPLLDAHGAVVGVVVRKSESENLNYAVPIEQLDAMSTTIGDFYGRFSEVEAGERLVHDWRFETPMPAAYGELATRAKAAYYDAYRANRARFETRFRDRIFPTASGLRAYLREQVPYYYPVEVVRDATGRWSAAEPVHESTHELEPGRFLYAGQSGDHVYLVLERPADLPLATFVNEPKRVIDAFLGAFESKREVAGVEVRITSWGAPHHREDWRDELGRPWISATWRLWNEQSTTAHCTPYPRGLACVLSEGGTWHEPLHLTYGRVNARRWSLSYDGRISDWIEYLALDPALRAPFLDGSITFARGRLSVSLGEFELAVESGASEDSVLFAAVEYASLAPLGARLGAISVAAPEPAGPHLRVERLLAPVEESSAGWIETWATILGSEPPFDGKIAHEGDRADVAHVQAAPSVDLPPDTGVEARLVVSCWTDDRASITDKALAKTCAAFRKSIRIATDR